MVTRNIVILPPPEVAREAMDWSRQIAAEYKTDFVLDGKAFYPHVTLYQAAYPDKNQTVLEEKLTALAKYTKSFQVSSADFSTIAGFVVLDFKKNEELVSLHKKIVTMCNPLREGENIPSEQKNLTDPNVPEFIKHSIRTYGSALDMEAFAPHITITRLQNFVDAEAAEKVLKYKSLSFTVSNIYLANIGLDGSVNEIFKEFPLQMV